MRCHDEWLAHPILPDQCRREMQGVERADRRRERLGCPVENRPLKQHEIDGLQPICRSGAPRDGLFYRERPLDAQPVERAKGLDGEQLTRNEGFAGPKVPQGARLAEHEPEERGGVEVGDHPEARSWSRTDRLSVGLEGGGGKRRSLGFRVA